MLKITIRVAAYSQLFCAKPSGHLNSIYGEIILDGMGYCRTRTLTVVILYSCHWLRLLILLK
jgi:hypothetical protein